MQIMRDFIATILRRCCTFQKSGSLWNINIKLSLSVCVMRAMMWGKCVSKLAVMLVHYILDFKGPYKKYQKNNKKTSL